VDQPHTQRQVSADGLIVDRLTRLFIIYLWILVILVVILAIIQLED
jgi:hypothetical protein